MIWYYHQAPSRFCPAFSCFNLKLTAFFSTGKALRNHVILSRSARSEIECSLSCLRHDQCESYNFQEDGEQHVCELNDHTALTSSRDLLRRNGFSYYCSGMVKRKFCIIIELSLYCAAVSWGDGSYFSLQHVRHLLLLLLSQKPCLNVICQNGGTCHPTLRSMAAPYCCLCEQRYQGDVCQHLMGNYCKLTFTVNYCTWLLITALAVSLTKKRKWPPLKEGIWYTFGIKNETVAVFVVVVVVVVVVLFCHYFLSFNIRHFYTEDEKQAVIFASKTRLIGPPNLG